MKISFRNRIFLLISIPYLILTILLLVTIKTYSQSEIGEILVNEMKTKAQLISEIFTSYGENNFKNNIERLKKAYKTEYRITIIDKEGKVIIDSEKDPNEMENHKDRPEFKRALEGSTGYSIRHSTTLNSDMAYVAIPITKENSIVGAARISMSLKDFSQKVNQLSKPILIYGFITIVLIYILIFLVTSKMIRPIDEMILVAEKIQRGDFSARLLLPPSKEYELLYNTLNNMLSNIQSLIIENQQKTNELNSIISSINEGIILLKRDFSILLTNKRFLQIVNIENKDVVGKKLYEVIKNSELNNVIKNCFEKMESTSDEIEINSNYYLISSSFNRENDTAIVLMYNISDIKKMQIYKKEFVANASHELKTPLTAINGFIDTLRDEITNETHRRYLEIIKNHTQRMINIINDLLALSSLESGIQFEFSTCDINELINEIIPLFKKRISEKNLMLNLKLENKSSLYCDRLKIEQALINIIDNAVKYTDKGSIEISTSEDEKNIIIEIEDTGIGIPRKDIDRIFERFYVVNKSRSRASGGTGLGLSIVKHIINRHNGFIDVSSEEGKGSKFTIRLPKNLTQS